MAKELQEIDIDLHYLFNSEEAELVVKRNAKEILDNIIKQTFPEVINGKSSVPADIRKRNIFS